MRFLVFKTTDAPSAYAWEAEDVEWPDEAPVPGAFRLTYDHDPENGNPAFPVEGWAVELPDLAALLALVEAHKGQNAGEVVVRKFSGQWTVEIYDGYRE